MARTKQKLILFSEDVIPEFPSIKLAVLRDTQEWALVLYRNGKWQCHGRRVRIRWWINLFLPYDLPGLKGRLVSKSESEQALQDISDAFAGYNKYLASSQPHQSFRRNKKASSAAVKPERGDTGVLPRDRSVRHHRK